MWPLLSWAENILDEFAFLILGIFILLRFPKSIFPPSWGRVGVEKTKERRRPVAEQECQANRTGVVMCAPSLMTAPRFAVYS